MNGYNWLTGDVREVFQRSHWKCIMGVPNWGKWGMKIGEPLIGFRPKQTRSFNFI